MKIEKLQGLESRVYEFIGPFAMNMERIRENGNPITTSQLHTWYICFDKENVAGFCSVKYAEASKNMQIGNLFILTGAAYTLKALINDVIKNTVGKGLGLRAYSNNENLPVYEQLGFYILKHGTNWHNLKYGKDERL